MTAKKKQPGLYANIHAKQERIAHGSGEKMREPGEKGAPSAASFKKAARTAKTTKAANTAKTGRATGKKSAARAK